MPDISTVSVGTTSGHDACPPVKGATGQSVMSVNGNAVQVIGDTFEDHGCPEHPTHTPVITSGSSTVSINGIPVAIVGSKVAGGGCTGEHVIAIGDGLISISN